MKEVNKITAKKIEKNGNKVWIFDLNKLKDLKSDLMENKND